MKKLFFSLVAVSVFATALISCQSNQKGTAEGGDDTTKTAASSTGSVKEASSSIAKTGSEILDVSPTVKVETPQFSSEDVNAGFAKFAVKSITFNTTTPSPQIDLDGQFS
ncbi:MAG: hypothetical protein EOO07_10745, partial [Chitinophagaceae bacterium]